MSDRFSSKCESLLFLRIVSCNLTVQDTAWFKGDTDALGRGSERLQAALSHQLVTDAHTILLDECKLSRYEARNTVCGWIHAIPRSWVYRLHAFVLIWDALVEYQTIFYFVTRRPGVEHPLASPTLHPPPGCPAT